jgi:proteasome lid subunit RPN8/RPN11
MGHEAERGSDPSSLPRSPRERPPARRDGDETVMAYQYTLDILGEDARPLDRVVVAPDWAPALEWVRFEGIREGRLPPVTAAVPGVVEPVWDGRAGEPIVAAFRAVVIGEGGHEVAREIPKAYVRSLVQRASADLVARGVLQAGDSFRYVISAFPATRVDGRQADGFSVEEIVQPLPLTDAPLASFFARSLPAGPDEPAGRVPVFMPRRVLDETVEIARQAGDVETGGVLVGKLRRDSGGHAAAPEIFVEITAQVPALHTVSQSTRLTFTAETWAAVQAAVTLRRQNELMAGWWHLHPDFCRLRNCPVERRARCPGASPFFSAEDVHLHATCFPSAYHVALLISDRTPEGMTWSLFGWSQGMVGARGFHVLDDPPTGGGAHATQSASGF